MNLRIDQFRIETINMMSRLLLWLFLFVVVVVVFIVIPPFLNERCCVNFYSLRVLFGA